MKHSIQCNEFYAINATKVTRFMVNDTDEEKARLVKDHKSNFTDAHYPCFDPNAKVNCFESDEDRPLCC